MSPLPNPIRVGIIGLGIGDGDFAAGLWAAKAHLPYLVASPHYTITAISNSSVASSQASIDHYKLGPNVKAYGSPEDIAADPNVDMVIVSVRVQKHYDLTKPALEAGKMVYVEWPLAATVSEAEELTALAKAKNLKTIVGVQARASPLEAKLRSILASGSLGTILSSTVNATFSGLPHDMFPVGAEYYLDINSGGNPFTIFIGHFLDSFVYLLGDFGNKISAVFDVKYPQTKLIDFTDPKLEVKGVVDRSAPDHVFALGKLKSGALASIAYRTVPVPQVQEQGLIWTITGTEGELVVETAPGMWQMFEADGLTVKLRKGKGEIEVIDLGMFGSYFDIT